MLLSLFSIINLTATLINMYFCANIEENKTRNKNKIWTNFYWDYYQYVKENPITTWNKNTCILYGTKDNMQEQNLIQDFSNKFNCKLSILENGEHYFHTKEQLDYYRKWLGKIIK